MELISYLLLAIIILLIFIVFKKTGQNDSLRFLQQYIIDIQNNLSAKINETNSILTEYIKMFNENQQKNFSINMNISKDIEKRMQEVREKLIQLEETNKQIINISNQLEGLENILKNPKQRGILGEYFLESLLKNVFQPNQYQMQYKFKDGKIVDAVIFVKDKIIPIDSKFSLENYNKLMEEKDPQKQQELEVLFKNDLKKRIDETSEYIKPHENTTDFAFMFIPSDGIYYDILINKIGTVKINASDLIEYAFNKKRVIIVSPNLFFAYLQTILQGLRMLQIEEKAKDMQKNVSLLNKHLLAYQEYVQKLGNSLSTTVNHYNIMYKEFLKIDKDILNITGEKNDKEIIEIKKPDID